MIIGGLIFTSLIWDTWHKYELDALMYQPRYMSVDKLGRITFRFTWNGFYAEFIYLSARFRRKHNPETKLCEKCMPERVVLIHIKGSCKAYGSARSLIRVKRFV